VAIWLLKTEPSEFSFDDLVARGVEPWDGVTSPAALGNMRRAQAGETCVIYHTGDERQAVGLATVERTAYPDPKKKDPRLVVVDLAAKKHLARPVTLDEIKQHTALKNFDLVRLPRLSVMPVPENSWNAVLALAQK